MFKTKDYKDGYLAGSRGLDELNNPHIEDAQKDNLTLGLGRSPFWETHYTPFLEWQLGYFKGREELLRVKSHL